MSKEPIYHPIKVRTKFDQMRGDLNRLFSRRYFWLAFLCYFLVAVLVILYLLKAPSYETNMALVLPGSGSSSNFSVEDIGQANAQTSSPFSGAGFSPQVNYKEIIKSRDVVKYAAKLIGTDEKSFGKPRVDLTLQTSILSIRVSGSSAFMAKRKALLLYESFQNRLDELRLDESLRHTEAVEKALRKYEIKLNEKRQAIVNFQQRSMIVSVDQMEHLLVSLSAVKEKQMYARSELKRKEDFVRQLSIDLGVSPLLAGKAFSLNTDSQFRGYLRELDESASRISQFKSHWGQNHPKVKSEQERFDAAKKALHKRSSNLVGSATADLLHTIDLTTSISRQQLFADLVDTFAQLQGDKAKLNELRVAENTLKDRLHIFSREVAELERLERDFKLSEAVYTSAAARLDAGKADIFASYPVVQMLTPPVIPEKQKSPNKKLAIAAGLGGFFLITIGLLTLWQRHYLIAQLLKRS